MGRTVSGWEREGTPRWRVHDKERSGACNARHKLDTDAPRLAERRSALGLNGDYDRKWARRQQDRKHVNRGMRLHTSYTSRQSAL